MLGMPVATLRVWERRYALTHTAHSPSGQRLYSADDVRRLGLLKQLTDLGHAIGSLAPLGMAQLQQVASTHAQALAATQAARPLNRAPQRLAKAQRAWRLVVVGPALGARLKRSALLRRLGRPVDMVGPFDDVAQAVAALAARSKGQAVDAWLLHQPQLHAGWLAATRVAVPALAPGQSQPLPMAVLYGMAAESVCEELADGGVDLLREPQPDVVLAQWLRRWAAASNGSGPVPGDVGAGLSHAAAAAPRRWDDAALSDFASLSTTVACECPRHVAELLMQLSRFEAYSAQCEHRNPADAELHAFLGRVAADARTSFEAALEQVALHEGLLLPAAPHK